MEYRELFEKIEKEKVESKIKQLDDIIESHKSGKVKYSSWESGGLLSVNVDDIDQKGKSIAFILEERYGVPSAGVRYSIAFGAIKGDKIYHSPFITVRVGSVSEFDDQHRWYDEVKILEDKDDKLIIGLKSRKVIDIYKIDLKKKDQSLIKRYDLEAEKVEQEKKDLEEKIEKSEDFKEKLELKAKILHKGYRRAEKPMCEVIERGDRKIGVIAIEMYDRDVDASVQAIDFFIYESHMKSPKKLLQVEPGWDRSAIFGERFFEVYSKKEISDKVIEESGKIRIPVKIKVIGHFRCGSPNAYSKKLGEQQVDIVYDLKKKQ